MAERKDLLKVFIELNISTKSRLSLNADIIADIDFGTAVIKRQSKHEGLIYSVEENVVQHLLRNILQSNDAEKPFKMMFAERVLKHTRIK